MVLTLDGYLDDDPAVRAMFELERLSLREADRIIWPGGDVLETYRRFYGEEAIAPATMIRHAVSRDGDAPPAPRRERGRRRAAAPALHGPPRAPQGRRRPRPRAHRPRPRRLAPDGARRRHGHRPARRLGPRPARADRRRRPADRLPRPRPARARSRARRRARRRRRALALGVLAERRPRGLPARPPGARRRRPAASPRWSSPAAPASSPRARRSPTSRAGLARVLDGELDALPPRRPARGLRGADGRRRRSEAAYMELADGAPRRRRTPADSRPLVSHRPHLLRARRLRRGGARVAPRPDLRRTSRSSSSTTARCGRGRGPLRARRARPADHARHPGERRALGRAQLRHLAGPRRVRAAVRRRRHRRARDGRALRRRARARPDARLRDELVGVRRRGRRSPGPAATATSRSATPAACSPSRTSPAAASRSSPGGSSSAASTSTPSSRATRTGTCSASSPPPASTAASIPERLYRYRIRRRSMIRALGVPEQRRHANQMLARERERRVQWTA